MHDSTLPHSGGPVLSFPQSLSSSSQSSHSLKVEEFNIFDFWNIVKKHFLKILCIPLALTLLAGSLTLMAPKKYRAQLSLVPILNSEGAGGGEGERKSAAPLNYLMIFQRTSLVVNILQSRTILEKVVNHFNLLPIFFKKQWDSEKKTWKLKEGSSPPMIADAVARLRTMVKIKDDKKSGLIELQVEMEDPILAANIANQMVIELRKFLTQNQVMMATQHRLFIEKQLMKNRLEFLDSGIKLSQFYGANKISTLKPIVDVDVSTADNTAEGTTTEIIDESLAALEKKKADVRKKIEEKKAQASADDKVLYQVPSQVYFQYLVLEREVLGKMNALLSQRFELAKIEEAREDTTFQVIDDAIPPRYPFQPKFRSNLIFGFIGGLFLSLMLVFFLEQYQKHKLTRKPPLSSPAS